MAHVVRDRSFWLGLVGAAAGYLLAHGVASDAGARAQAGAGPVPHVPAVAGASVAPRLIPFQAYLTDETGRPVEGEHALAFALYRRADGGEPNWSESHPAVSVRGGVVNVLLGSIQPFGDLTFDDVADKERAMRTKTGLPVMRLLTS